MQTGETSIVIDFLDLLALLKKMWMAAFSLSRTDLSHDVLEQDAECSEAVQYSNMYRYVLQADCNRVTGNWTLDDTTLTITPGPATLALCP
ncbi:hypothetical protein MGEO_20150 [Marivita geojedonensis]|uniref:Uncharacterized protein n=1 Tax=Marivita geojedonensis TaxID=1123756 RepID=A0A1X4N980_9RHOB|nr:hypothetical protein MGEO_20150 [Marivita geojedonensis]